ncbi:hypothetical protein V8C35DRAFT_72203 [Trichoderma chlorosporum]
MRTRSQVLHLTGTTRALRKRPCKVQNRRGARPQPTRRILEPLRVGEAYPPRPSFGPTRAIVSTSELLALRHARLLDQPRHGCRCVGFLPKLSTVCFTDPTGEREKNKLIVSSLAYGQPKTLVMDGGLLHIRPLPVRAELGRKTGRAKESIHVHRRVGRKRVLARHSIGRSPIRPIPARTRRRQGSHSTHDFWFWRLKSCQIPACRCVHMGLQSTVALGTDGHSVGKHYRGRRICICRTQARDTFVGGFAASPPLPR